MDHETRRFFLRAATHSDHQELDQLIGPLTSEAAYRRYLKSLAAFRAGAEQAIRAAAWPDALSSWAPASLTPLMQADLQDLRETSAPVPALAPPASVSALLGMLYVLEGSSLGARLLAKQVSTLGFTKDFGARHLAVQTASPDNWQAFLRLLDAAPEWDAKAAAAAAHTLFRYAIDAVRRTDSLTEHTHG